MNYVVTSDSTCDLTAEQIAEYGIVLRPLTVVLGGKEYSDNVDINVDRVLAYVDNGGDLPKTAATSIEEYKDFFAPFVNEGKKVIHFNISSNLSSCNQNANNAAKELGNVFVVDSEQLSTGQGLLVLKACQMLKEGKTIEETFEAVNNLKRKVQTSFVVDRLDFLHKGGRCSLAQFIGAKLLKLHPHLSMVEGSLKVKKKYQGNMRRALDSYVNDLANEYTSYDKSICFVTHCKGDAEYVDLVYSKVKELFEFENIVVSEAGTTISSHCGKNTIGVLFITE